MTTATQRGSVLVAPSPADSDRFGIGLACDAAGTAVVVGAPLRDNPATDRGGVYTYDWSGSAWVQRGSLFVHAGAHTSEQFGASLALSADGNVLIVGSPGRSDGGVRGAVYTYDRTGSTWTQRGSIMYAADAANYDAFGQSVALSDDGLILVVGAPYWEGAATDQGAVYTYDWSGSAWVQRGSVLVASDAEANDYFGFSVSLNATGNILAVGAYKWEGATADQGAVYIYDLSGGSWVERAQKVTAASPANNRFGYDVALDAGGYRLMVGAPRASVSGVTAGSVYHFIFEGETWTEEAIVSAGDYGDFDEYGESVACSSTGAIYFVGAGGWDGSASDQGGVYVYDYDGPEIFPAAAAVVVPTAHRYRLSAYISGVDDALPDYPFVISSFGLSKRSGSISYYSISTPFSSALIDALAARPNGKLHIVRDGNPWENCNIGYPVRYDIGPGSSSISISGTRQETTSEPVEIALENRMLIATGVNSSGDYTFDLVPGIVDPRPADVVVFDTVGYTVTLVKFQARAGGQTLSINAEPV